MNNGQPKTQTPYPIPKGQWVSIDPGVPCAGCVWSGSKLLELHLWKVSRKSDVPIVGESYLGKVSALMSSLVPLLDACDMCVCEQPFMVTSGHAGMVASRGDVVKLSYFVGALYMMCEAYDCTLYLAPVHRWKGQLSKEKTTKRIKECLSTRLSAADYDDVVTQAGNVSHIWDAIGIGLYTLGVF